MPNRLSSSTSPYLLQHADNPVDWYEWGPEAFAEARRTDRPLLVSIGYSSCHWCHVMAHESFEDPDTAEVMNRLFVNVKVDREERPDVDSIYMEATQAMRGQGGWPLTVWITPEAEPFYVGTYFPSEDRHGMPSFRRVMAAVTEAWDERRSEITEQAGRITEAISRTLPPAPDLGSEQTLIDAYRSLESSFDPTNGGFGAAPKFPQAPVLDFLLHVSSEPWAPQAAWMLQTTLQSMARGGIYDQLGGGFARYSVDASWLVPHFEKMLYDNAQLARIYLRAWQVTGDDDFRRVTVETLHYLLADLGQPDGGIFAAEDADSEGVEGKFYVWSADEFRRVVGAENADVAAAAFGVSDAGNFEGKNILWRASPPEAVAERFDMQVSDVRGAVERAAERLRTHRENRVRPGLDDKVVAAWNGLALRSLAEAGAVLGDERYLEAARRIAWFIEDRLMVDGRLMRSWSKNKTSVAGFLEDYAAVSVGLFSLYQATGEVKWFEAARRLVENMVETFSDPEGGAFFTTGEDTEGLIKRPRDQFDNPSPSGNSLAA
ncbi:MAG: thioredoxin domain-containing protein, partial [Actinomycetota bacterium]|nr:thioredoxin domain-containing protein [Actinomycetota bacterium]